MLDDIFLSKISEIARLHDEAFAHYQKFDKHAKISDGHIAVEISFGNTFERRGNTAQPSIGITLYSYVVAIPREEDYSAPTYYFETVDDALEAMIKWHESALSFHPSEEEQQAWNQIAEDFMKEMIESGKLTIHNISEQKNNKPQEYSDTISCTHCNGFVSTDNKSDGTYYCLCGRVAIQKINGDNRVLGYPGDII